MFRHALTLLLIVALLLGLGWLGLRQLGLRQLGWLKGPQPTVPSTAPPTPQTPTPPTPTPPTPTPPTQAEPPQPNEVEEPVPTVPAQPLSAPTPSAPETAPVEPVPHAAPPPPVPQVRVLSPPVPTRPVPTPPQPQVVILPPPQRPASRLTVRPGQPSPLAALNAVRRLAGLPSVRVEPKWQAECDAHATYLTVTDTGSHSEDPASPHYSRAGANCAHGHYYVTMRPEATAQQAITYWQNGPFHLPQLIDPRLTRAALSVKHDAAGDLHTAAVMDLKRGRDGPAKYPVRFPRPGSTVTPQALSQFEFPDALPGCPGYTHPAGAPIALLLGYGGITRTVELRVNGKPVETCLLTAQTFTGADEGETGVGRSVLDAQGVAVAVPRRPLPASARVDVRFQTNSGPISWSFRTR